MNQNIFTKTSLSIALAISLTSGAEIVTAKSNETKTQALASIDVDSALKELKSGNQRFLTSKIRTDRQSTTELNRLSKDQAPNSIVLACSDSRVLSEVVFDQKLGEMFIVRSAGAFSTLIKLRRMPRENVVFGRPNLIA